MSKYFASAVLGLGMFVFAGSADAGAPHQAPVNQAPMKSAAVPQASRAVRSYSYEPGVRSYSYEPAASYRNYGRTYGRAAGGFNNATTKGHGNY